MVRLYRSTRHWWAWQLRYWGGGGGDDMGRTLTGELGGYSTRGGRSRGNMPGRAEQLLPRHGGSFN